MCELVGDIRLYRGCGRDVDLAAHLLSVASPLPTIQPSREPQVDFEGFIIVRDRMVQLTELQISKSAVV